MTFRNTSLVFLFAIILCGLGHYYFGFTLWWVFLPIILYKAAIIYGSSVIQSNFYIEAHCKGATKEKVVAITFDDGPDPGFTLKIIQVLNHFDVKATFFVIGKNIRGNEAIIKQIDSEGHILGNHTFSHSFFIDFKGRKAFREELTSTMAAVYKLTGRQMKFFRPPYGVTTPHLANASKDLDYEVIGWNIRSMDTTGDSEEIITNRIKEQMKPGSIILFHDTSEKTVNVLKQTLNFAKENGFKIVSTERLLGLKAYEI
jgi:peptidoglycan/xylan/chitin deacetylase (PgdA/CDA1 family)